MVECARTQACERFAPLASLKISRARLLFLLYQQGQRLLQRVQSRLQRADCLLAAQPLLGRQRELAELLDALAHARHRALQLLTPLDSRAQRPQRHLLLRLPILQDPLQSEPKSSHGCLMLPIASE